MVIFYLDGQPIGPVKAKTTFMAYGLKHGHELAELTTIWKFKARCKFPEMAEDLREQINNITESTLEVFVE